MVRYISVFLLFFYITFGNAQQLEISSGRKAVRLSGDITAGIIPVACLAMTLILHDYEGLKQGIFTGVSTVGLSYALKYIVKKERPDKSDRHSFPSLHTSTSFAGATFLLQRYGWKWSLPAFALAAYTGWSRTYAKKHDWWDVGAGALIGAGCAYLFTTPYVQKHNITLAPAFGDNHLGVYLSMRF